MKNRRGTTLIELLVVIVVFLVGILAVVQIFPKGFQLLITNRNNTQATALARDEVERYKSIPDQIPDAIEAVYYVGGTPVVNPNKNIFDLGPDRLSNTVGQDYIDGAGNLWLNGANVGNWQLHSGANGFRRIIGEGQRVPAPRNIGTTASPLYGGLRVLGNGPLDNNNNNTQLFVYANDMAKLAAYPSDLTPGATANVTIDPANPVVYSATTCTTSVSLSPFEYFVGPPQGALNPSSADACLILPTNLFRTYHISLSAYIGTGSNFVRTDLPDLAVNVAGSYAAPLVEIPIATILADSGILTGGKTMASVEYDSIRVQPEYYTIPTGNVFSADPFQYKLLDSNLGVLLFNPVAYQSLIELPGGAREPLIAKVDYDVLDWRILKQDFRIDSQLSVNGPDYAQFQLSLPGVLVGTSTGPDGLQNGGLASLETPLPAQGANTPYASTQNTLSDNVMIQDLTTGGILYENDPNTPSIQLITVDKRGGVITVHGAPENTTALTGFILLPGATTPTQMDLTGRTFRVMYRARNNWAVFPTKAASLYSITTSSPPSVGQVYAPAGGTQIFFPVSDLHQKVTIDQIYYSVGGVQGELDSQDFVIEYPVTGGSLPCIDISSVAPSGATLSASYGEVARGIKGASLTVQVIWNPATFSLGGAPIQLQTQPNQIASVVDTWIQSYRRSTNQTYLQTELIP